MQENKTKYLPNKYKHKADFLLSLYASKNLAPCWLIYGHKGIGKNDFAKMLATEILSQNPTNPNGMARDLLAHHINNLSYPNFLYINKPIIDEKQAGEIPIAEAHRVLDFLQHSPVIPGWRVVIIDAVDDLNRSSANCLLKILEEPPANTAIFLICHGLANVLPTIKSRCQRLDLQPLKLDDMDEEIDPEVFSICQGSLGKYRSIIKCGGNSFIQEVTHLINSAFAGKNIAAAQKFCQESASSPEKYECLLWLIPFLVYQECTKLSSTGGDVLKKWLDVAQRLNDFIAKGKECHLDKNIFMLNVFLIIENPKL